MSLKYLVSPELEKTLKKQKKKDPTTIIAFYKKFKQIINSTEEEINHYKNLKNPLNNYKRVHLNKSFVLIFSFDKKSKTITFYELSHHDQVYNKHSF